MTQSGPIVERKPVRGTCPYCGEPSLAEYDVVGESGWAHVIKCQDCLTSVERTPATSRLGPITLLIDMV